LADLGCDKALGWLYQLLVSYIIPLCALKFEREFACSAAHFWPSGTARSRRIAGWSSPKSSKFPDTVSVVTSEFVDEGGKTRFTATVRYPSLMVRDMVIASGMSRGAGISYDRLEDLVAQLQR